jgi:hypothetical protein
MCGKQRTLSPVFLDVWQATDLQDDFSDVWQRKELANRSAYSRTSITQKVTQVNYYLREHSAQAVAIWSNRFLSARLYLLGDEHGFRNYD